MTLPQALAILDRWAHCEIEKHRKTRQEGRPPMQPCLCKECKARLKGKK